MLDQKNPHKDDEIRHIAYDIWVKEGRPAGKSVEHWLKAESAWAARSHQGTTPAHSGVPTPWVAPASPKASTAPDAAASPLSPTRLLGVANKRKKRTT